MTLRDYICGSLIAATLACVAGCEPPKAAKSHGVVAGSSSAPPAPPPPPPDPSAPAAEQSIATLASADAPAGESAAPAPESPSEPPPPSDVQPSGIPGVSAQGLPTGDPFFRPESTAPTSTAPAPSQPTIRLSGGIALAQTLPNGTQIGVSVDYRITGQLKSSARYALVIETGAGEMSIPAKISPQGGTLMGFLPPSVRPEHGPFSARIDEVVSSGGKGAIVSNRLALR